MTQFQGPSDSFWPLTGDMVEMRFTDERSNKFWAKYDLHDPMGRIVTVYNWGRIGATGQFKVTSGHDFAPKIEEKLRKGYEHAGTVTNQELPESFFGAMVRQQIEAALIQNGRNQGVEPAPDPVNVFDQAQALVQKTIAHASSGGDDAEAVMLHHELSTKVAELRASLDQVEAGAEVAEAAVRAKWDS